MGWGPSQILPGVVPHPVARAQTARAANGGGSSAKVLPGKKRGRGWGGDAADGGARNTAQGP